MTLRPEKRAGIVSALLAVAGVFAVVGSAVEGTAQRLWFGVALISAFGALAVNVVPESRRLPWDERRRLKEYRDRLVPRAGWSPGVVPVVGGTLLLIHADPKDAMPGFLCEVHGPEGVYYGMTPEAQQLAEGPLVGDVSSVLAALPTVGNFTGLTFPRHFADAEGRPPHPPFALARGEYHALWFAWEQTESLSVRLVFLAGVSFQHGLAATANQT